MILKIFSSKTPKWENINKKSLDTKKDANRNIVAKVVSLLAVLSNLKDKISHRLTSIKVMILKISKPTTTSW